MSGRRGLPRSGVVLGAVVVLVLGAVVVWLGVRGAGDATTTTPTATGGGPATAPAAPSSGTASVTPSATAPAAPSAAKPATGSPAATGTGTAAAGPVRVVAGGDIACDPEDGDFNGGAGTATHCSERATADLIAALKPQALLALGDLQYESGKAAAFAASYDKTWGRFKDITYPAPGNHDYGTDRGAPYFAYFGARAGEPGKGWYSVDLGSWHVISLNSNCDGGVRCDDASEQVRWLRADLAAHPGRCTLAYWHHARWSDSTHGDTTSTAPFVRALYAAGADVLLAGHDHVYERMTPLSADGRPDPNGLREFVVGGGGRSHYGVRPSDRLEASDTTSFGVLQLTLRDGGYDWTYVPVAGSSFTDTGSGTCHGTP